MQFETNVFLKRLYQDVLYPVLLQTLRGQKKLEKGLYGSKIFCLYSHGTQLSGLMAAEKDNGQCSVGVAYHSTLIGR